MPSEPNQPHPYDLRYEGYLNPVDELGEFVSHSVRDVDVEITNASETTWTSSSEHPVRASYHWFDSNMKPCIPNGRRTALPEPGVPASGTARFSVAVESPPKPGIYYLMLTLLHERVCWFEKRRFRPYITQVIVEPNNQTPRCADSPHHERIDRTASGSVALKHHVQGVSFPRSGHHMLVRFLCEYFGPKFRYCEYYNDCGKQPCTNSKSNLQKHHDLELDLPKDHFQHYLIQYRHPLYSVTSNYSLYFRGLQRQGRLPKDIHVGEEPPKFWRKFAKKDTKRWKRWIRKWVLSNDELPDALTLVYEDVMRQPQQMFQQVVEYFCPRQPADTHRIAKLTADLSIQPKKRLEDFQHFDAGFFRKLEASVKEELELLGYERITWSEELPKIAQRRAA